MRIDGIRRRVFLVLAAIGLMELTGCQEQGRIARYQVPHEAAEPASSAPTDLPPGNAASGSPAAVAGPQRMLASIVPTTTEAWFFKAMGPIERIEAIAGEFQQLMQSLQFADAAGPPSWTLPSGWTQRAGNEMRYATLEAQGIEVTVSKLSMPPNQPREQYFLSNVNRWRNQLQLAPIPLEQLSATTTSITIGGQPALYLDLTGTGTSGPPAMAERPAPTAAENQAAQAAAAPAAAANPIPGAAANSSGIRYDTPSGWQPGRTGGMRLAAFQIDHAGQAAEVTIIALGPAAGSALDNVNRWRGQIQLEPVDQAELDRVVQPVNVSGTAGQLIELTDVADDGQAILAAIVPQSSQTLFIKMLGSRTTVVAERENFRAFLASLQLPAAE